MKSDANTLINLLESPFQSEFPIADERHQNRFENFLGLIDSTCKAEKFERGAELYSIVITFSLQLEKHIDSLSKYCNENLRTEATLESHPLSYSLKVFIENHKTLREIAESIKFGHDNIDSIIGNTKNLLVKEFDPG